MSAPVASPLFQQLRRVSRRLFVQTVVNALVWSWSAALVLSAGWFLVQPFVIPEAAPWLRWAVAGSCFGVGTLLATGMAVWLAPSRLAAALSLDERFGLKERVTTSLTLTPELAATPAGQALLSDVNQRLHHLDVGARFPVRLNWSAALVPVGAALLAAVAVFYEPPKSQANITRKDDETQKVANAAEIDKKMKELRKREATPLSKQRSEEIEKLEAELAKIANRPRDTQEQLRERVKEMTALEDQMKEREKQMAEKMQSLRQQLKQMDKMAGMAAKDGPAKDLEKALADGKMDDAKQEIEKLIKKVQNNQLTDKEKQQLQKQLEDLQQKLERVAQQKEREQQLKQANLDPETLKREMKLLDEEKKRLQDLQDLANKLGQCQQKMKEGDLDGAMQDLQGAAQQMKDLTLDEQDLQDLRDQLSRLQDAKDSC